MKVGLLTRWISDRGGGVSGAVLGLAEALVARGIDAVVCHSEPGTASDVACRQIAARHFGPEGYGYAPELYDCLMGEDVDVLHLHGLWTYGSLAALRWRSSTGRPLIVSPHGMLDPIALRYSPTKKTTIFRLYERRMLKSASIIHGLCDSESLAIKDLLGPDAPTINLPNGVSPYQRSTAAPDWAANLPEGSKVLLYLGRLHPKKNLAALLGAWEVCVRSARLDNWYLAVAGWGDRGYVDDIRASVRDQRSSRILFCGPQFGGQKAATLGRADCFILPSLSEGLPLAVLEAWAAGLPVLMTAFCNLEEGFQAGAAVPVGTSLEALADGLAWLDNADDADLRTIGIHGQELVAKKFNWDAIAASFAHLYMGLR